MYTCSDLDHCTTAPPPLPQSGEYAKGKGREFTAWRVKHYPTHPWIPILRAKGGRQDVALDGAVPIFLNRRLLLEFLHPLVHVPGADNKLEKFLWRTLR